MRTRRSTGSQGPRVNHSAIPALFNCNEAGCLFLFSLDGISKDNKSVTVWAFMAKTVAVSMSEELLDAIFDTAKHLYPRETLLMLRGKKVKDTIRIVDLVIPPLANYGHGFANYQLHLLPMDFSLVGTVHSHPSGNTNPSSVDLNHFFGRILMIVGYPYAGAQNVSVYNAGGEKLVLQVTKE